MADRKELETLLKNGDYKVFTILRGVSRSGMTRSISVAVCDKKAVVTGLDARVAEVLGRKLDNNGIICRGCGMDMGFELVYSLSQALYKDGYKLKQEWI